jgi:spermidine/putrescine transport system ATP-binding protein
MAGEVAIELKGVRKAFDEVVAVHRFDVGIKKGEFFSLLGPSGCGKTTTLRMIAGLEEPTEGEILLEGRDVSRVPPYRRNVHTVFQDYALFPHMNVRKNVWFPLKMRGVSLANAKERIERVLRIVSMEGFERRLPQQLSGGQRQRVALARSLVDEPAALLLDEPLGALDFKLRVAMQKVLKDIQRTVGITFIYVTHDQTEALTMSDRIAVMKDGRVHQVGTPDEIYNSPATAFVASFIGDMNFLHGRLVSFDGTGCAVDVNGRAVKAARAACLLGGEAKNAPGTDAAVKAGDDVLVCIRTERVQVNPPRETEHGIEGTVKRIVYRGTDYEATCAFAEQEIRAVVSSVTWDPAVAVGSRVRIGFNAADVSIFPRSEESMIIQYSSEAV